MYVADTVSRATLKEQNCETEEEDFVIQLLTKTISAIQRPKATTNQQENTSRSRTDTGKTICRKRLATILPRYIK